MRQSVFFSSSFTKTPCGTQFPPLSPFWQIVVMQWRQAGQSGEPPTGTTRQGGIAALDSNFQSKWQKCQKRAANPQLTLPQTGGGTRHTPLFFSVSTRCLVVASVQPLHPISSVMNLLWRRVVACRRRTPSQPAHGSPRCGQRKRRELALFFSRGKLRVASGRETRAVVWWVG